VTVRITHTVHLGAIRSLFAPGSRVYQDIIRRAIKVQNGARRRAAVDTGRLRSSINVTAPVVRDGASGARIGTNVEYAIYVEKGTRYMRARPYLEPALQDARG
jgi:HK97 gp10 family phage protein